MRNLTIAVIIILAVVFRFFQLGNLPPAPYWEEVALGYDAFSILKTGKDHHGNWFPIVAFESFGDWKPGFYIYTVVPSIFLFGLNTFAVRLPSALAGLNIVIGIGVLADQLFLKNHTFKRGTEKTSQWLPLLCMLVAAVEPWGILLSRGAWETNLATALTLWAIIAVFKHSRQPQINPVPWYLIVSAILSVLAMYTYHAARISSPLLVFSAFLFIEFQSFEVWKNARKRRLKLKQLIVPTLVVVIMVAPLLINSTSNTVTNRFTTTSIFSDLSIIINSNQLKEQANNSLFSRLLYHRYLLFGREMVLNFVKNFDLGYLFLHGDTNPRHSIQYFGQLYPLSLPLILVGLSVLFYRYKKAFLFFITWFICGLLPSTLVEGSPHAVRSLVIFPIWVLLIGLGLHRLLDWLSRTTLNKKHFLTGLFSVVFVLQINVFWVYYSQVYSKKYANEWQYGYAGMISAVNQLALQYPNDQIYITREQGRPAMYYWFYSQTDPRIVQSYEATASKDQSEFLQLGRLHFIDSPDQVATSYGILAASPKFMTLIGLEISPESFVISSADEKPIWIIQQYEK